MKTSFDLPDGLLREAKAAAARQGRPLRDLVAEALEEKLRMVATERRPLPPVRQLRGRGPMTIEDIKSAAAAGRD